MNMAQMIRLIEMSARPDVFLVEKFTPQSFLEKVAMIMESVQQGVPPHERQATRLAIHALMERGLQEANAMGASDRIQLSIGIDRIIETINLNEKAPPGHEAETWIKHRKKEFKARYGKRWKQVLYAKAWKLFGD